jgi:hypothetical protein
MVHFASRLAACLALVAFTAPPADAISACTDNAASWVSPGATVPPHARLVYYTAGYGDPNATDDKLVATIDKKPVKTKITHLASAPYKLTIVEIDSDKTGTLTIGYGKIATEHYKIVRKVDMPQEIKGATSRYHRAYEHSTVHESYDGLAITLPAGTPAMSAHIKIRRDSKADWSELDVPIRADDATKAPAIWIGELGCVQNYTPALLESGVDLEVTVTLADGSTRNVSGIGSHVVLPKLPANAPKSRP